jgi:hypothetical protein
MFYPILPFIHEHATLILARNYPAIIQIHRVTIRKKGQGVLRLQDICNETLDYVASIKQCINRFFAF